MAANNNADTPSRWRRAINAMKHPRLALRGAYWAVMTKTTIENKYVELKKAIPQTMKCDQSGSAILYTCIQCEPQNYDMLRSALINIQEGTSIDLDVKSAPKSLNTEEISAINRGAQEKPTDFLFTSHKTFSRNKLGIKVCEERVNLKSKLVTTLDAISTKNKPVLVTISSNEDNFPFRVTTNTEGASIVMNDKVKGDSTIIGKAFYSLHSLILEAPSRKPQRLDNDLVELGSGGHIEGALVKTSNTPTPPPQILASSRDSVSYPKLTGPKSGAGRSVHPSQMEGRV